MRKNHALLITAGILGVTTVIAPALLADSILIARDTTTPTTREAASVSAPASQARQVRAVPNIPRGVTVFDATGSTVTLQRAGAKPITQRTNGGQPIRFTGLVAGKAYRVIVDGQRIATVTPVHAVSPATNLRVGSTPVPGTVQLTWNHAPRGTEGDVSFLASATSQTAPAIEHEVIGGTSTTLSGLRGNALYTFTITPLNVTGPGKPTRAVMNRTLDELVGKAVAAEPIPVQPVRAPEPPAPPPAPAPDPGPATQTIYVCPEGFTDIGQACEERRAYTFHEQARVGTRTVDTSQVYAANIGPLAQGPACPWGGHLNASGDLCIIPGSATETFIYTVQVKDPTPGGFTDDGTDWVRKAEKIARVVPA